MEETISRILIMTCRRQNIAIVCITIAMIAFVAMLLGLHETIYGIVSRYSFWWHEESFVGGSASDLQSYLTSQNKGMVPVHSDVLLTVAGRQAKPSQRVWRFVKGKEYYWFGNRTAVNVGYVVTETQEDKEQIVEIMRGLVIDGP